MTVSRTRHLVRPGAVTSLCGTTALPADTWTRTNSRKPACSACLAEAEQSGEPIPTPRNTDPEGA